MTHDTREAIQVATFVLVFAAVLALLYGASGSAICAFRPIDANANLGDCK